MEEVWKDINLSSLHDHLPSRDKTRATTFHGMTFQEFLARPFSTDPPASTFEPGKEVHVPGNSDNLKHHHFLQNQKVPQISQHDFPFDPFTSVSGLVSNGKRRCPESDKNNSGDRRYKKMIKNRESAARSRARKQAYTDELELELARLLEENLKLKKQKQLCVAASVQKPKKNEVVKNNKCSILRNKVLKFGERNEPC